MDRKSYGKLSMLILFSVLVILVFIYFSRVASSQEGEGGEGGCGGCGEGAPTEGGEGGEGGTTVETTTPTTVPFCGDGLINNGEQCELPNTNNNAYCTQTTSACSGNQTGTRDNKGNCGSTCQCSQDPFTYNCVKDSCGAQCVINSDCANKCVNSVRYYNGQCGSTSCACTYTTENCNNYDGWYNTTETKWVNLNACKEKEQLKRDYRDYTCSEIPTVACTYTNTSTDWVDTGKTRNKPDGTICGSNTTTCNSDYCSALVHYNWTYSPCDRLCEGGVCGKCNTCTLTTDDCEPSGCCDATCSASTGCGLSSNDANCPNYCVGNVRYFNGDCDSRCGCNYQTENCNDNDGWYNTSTKQWVDLSVCKEKEQLKQKYRDYSCDPVGCTYIETDERWIDTGKTRNKPDGTDCGTNSTSCPASVCNQLNFTGYEYDPCTRLCDKGVCGYCNSCIFTFEQCKPSGCCDATCDSLTGCGLSQDDDNCPNYCSGSKRYYSGSCGISCMCSYSSEDCNNYDGWYNLTETKWISLDACREKEQRKQEYRNYFCEADGCDYTITSYRWVDTGQTRNLPPGTVCGMNKTSCPSDSCSNSIFKDWTYGECERTCDAQGRCGTCESCDFETETCNDEGCCDGVCNPFFGCSVVANNKNCPTYCSGDVRYFSGSCSASTCDCSYQSEDCGALSGWHDTTVTKREMCWNDPCQTCENVKQEYRQYYCTLIGCKYSVTSTRWVEKSREDVVCRNGKICDNGRCVYTCEGFVQLKLTPDPYCPDTRVKATISGLSHCVGRTAYMKEDSCDGPTIDKCRVGSIGCNIYFKMSEVGSHDIVVCVDKNLDGDYSGSGEQIDTTVTIDCHSCMSKVWCNSRLTCNDWCSSTKMCLNIGETCIV